MVSPVWQKSNVMPLSTCSNFTEIVRMRRFYITAACSLLWMLPAYALGAGEVYVLSGDRISIAQKTYCLAGIQGPAIGQTCQRANGRSFDCGHISKTALMDLTAGAKVLCKAIQETTSCTIAKCSADGFDLSRNMVHTGWALGVDHQFKDVQERAKRKKTRSLERVVRSSVGFAEDQVTN